MKRFFSLSCLFLMLGAAAWAQGTDLDRIVVTASRMDQLDYQLASNVTVIREEDIQQSSAATVSGILQEQMGLNVFDKSTKKTAMIDIRGFNDAAAMNVLILVNGRKVNSIDLSGTDLLQIPLESVQQIEVVRGAGSVLYGDNAVGGVVNIITKEGRGPMSARLGSYAGSYGRRGSDVEISGSEGSWNYYSYVKYYDDKGYRSNSDVLGKDFNGQVGYTVSDKMKVDLFTSWHEDDYGLPGGLNETELETLGRRGSADDQDFANSKDRHIHLRIDSTPWPEDLNLGHLVCDLSYRNRDTYAEFAAWNFGTKRNIDTYGLNLKYAFNEEIRGRDVNFVTGLDLYDVGNDILGSGSNTDDIVISKQEAGVYGFAEWEAFPSFYVNAGTRYQRADYTFDQRSGTSNYEKKRADETVSMAGVKYEYAKGSNVFANVQQTFRFLATDEWYDTWNGLDTALDQQTGTQYEVGFKHAFSDKATLGITPYWIEIEDEIFFDPENTFFGKNSNYDTTRRRGVETELRWDISRMWNINSLTRGEMFASYTFQDAEFIDGVYDGKRIPMVPWNQAAVGMNMELFGKYQWSLSGRYIGSRYAINDTLNATGKLEPHVVLDTQFAYERNNWRFYIAVNNILNEKYFSYVSKSATSDTKDYYPAAERNFTVGMNVRW